MMRVGIVFLFQISARRLSQLFIGKYYIGCGMFVINGFYYVEKCFLRPRVFFIEIQIRPEMVQKEEHIKGKREWSWC